jgi:hypothetical protein
MFAKCGMMWGTVFNISNPNGYLMHQQVEHSKIVRSVHTVFMRFVFISGQTAIFAIYDTN